MGQPSRIPVLVRLPADLLDEIDERVTTNDLSRNETIIRMLRYATAKTGGKVKITHTEEWSP